MAIPVLIDRGFIERIIQQTFRDGLIPEIEGRLGKSNIMHACYKLRLTEPPMVITTDAGSLIVRVPVEGHLSIPWGWGTKFTADAEADLQPKIVDGSLQINIGEFEINSMSIGGGCSFPPEILRLVGPFVKGAVFPSSSGKEGGALTIELPVITVPLSEISDLIEGPSEIKIELEDVMVSERGVSIYIALPGETRPALPPQPSSEGYDLAVALPQGEVQRLIEMVIGEDGIDVDGEEAFAIPDQTRFVDLLKASGESISSLGRRGLGRRALKSSSRIKLSFKAKAKAPTIEFIEGNKIFLHNLPGHLVANANVEMDMPKSGFMFRLKSFFNIGGRTDGQSEAEVETVNLAKWTYDKEFMIKEVEVSVATDEAGKLDIKVIKLEIDLDLKWYLPERTIEEVTEFIGKKIATSELPKAIPSEMDLPGDIPLKVVLDRVVATTVPGTMLIRANLHIDPQGSVEQARGAVKEIAQEQIAGFLKNGLQ